MRQILLGKRNSFISKRMTTVFKISVTEMQIKTIEILFYTQLKKIQCYYDCEEKDMLLQTWQSCEFIQPFLKVKQIFSFPLM